MRDHNLSFGSTDRRSEPRHTSVLRLALLLVNDEAQLCRITNISPQGVKVTVFRPVKPESRVTLRVPDGISLSGSVVWAEHGRIGVNFARPLPEAELLRLRNQAGAVQARRRLPRLRVGGAAWLKSGAKRYRIELLDLSPAGAMISANHQLPGLGPVDLQLVGLPCIGTQIRWIQGYRSGLLFNEAIPLDLLTSWLERHRTSGADMFPRPEAASAPDVKPDAAALASAARQPILVSM